MRPTDTPDPLAAIRRLVHARVHTPHGPGTVHQVFANRVAVALDHDPSQLTFMAPSAVRDIPQQSAASATDDT